MKIEELEAEVDRLIEEQGDEKLQELYSHFKFEMGKRIDLMVNKILEYQHKQLKERKNAG